MKKTEARMIYHFPARNGSLRPEMTLHGRKLPLQLEMSHSRPEMTAQLVNMTRQSLLLAAKQPKRNNRFCFFSVFSTAPSRRKRLRSWNRTHAKQSKMSASVFCLSL
jgi:hypothetical protein